MLHDMDGSQLHLDVPTAHRIGLAGEAVVRGELEASGWAILAERWRCRWGELDLVARRNRTIAFVEVKACGPGRRQPWLPLDRRSRHRIRRAAVAWIASHAREHPQTDRFRFDVAQVKLRDDGDHEVHWLRNAF